MEPARRRVLDDFPFPMAYPYKLIFDPAIAPSSRRWALCFTEYQLLRLLTLPMVGQYLREPITPNPDSIRALNSAITGIRAPFFSDWIGLAHVLNVPRGGYRIAVSPRRSRALPRSDCAWRRLEQLTPIPTFKLPGRKLGGVQGFVLAQWPPAPREPAHPRSPL